MLTGVKLTRFLAQTTQRPLSGVLTGTISTAILQSSSATTVAAVGFVSAGLLTFPQALGIIFGVCSVVAMLAIGEGASQQAQQQIERLGSTNIIVNTVKPPEEQVISGSESRMNEYGLTYADAERFHATIPNAQVIVPLRQINQEAWYRNRKVAIEVIGTVPWYPQIASMEVIRGRFLNGVDMGLITFSATASHKTPP